MDFGRITIDRDLVLYLFGTPGQDRFDFMWEILGEGMIGYLLLVDATREESVHEAAGILDAFRTMARVPYVVALNRASGDDHALVGRVREQLEIPSDVAILPATPPTRSRSRTSCSPCSTRCSTRSRPRPSGPRGPTMLSVRDPAWAAGGGDAGGRHRRPDPPVQVILVLAGGQEVVVPPGSALARSIGQVAALLAHW